MSWVLLLQVFGEKPKGISCLETQISGKYENFCFALDNFSEDISLNYAKRLLDDCDTILMIIWEHDPGDWVRIQPVLSRVLGNRKKIKIISNASNIRLERLAKLVPYEKALSEELLLKSLEIN